MRDGNFIIIVGAPRSGTTLLTLNLEAKFGFAIPVETHFIPLFQKSLWCWGGLKNFRNRKRVIDCIYGFLEIWTLRAMKERNISKILKFSLLCTRDKAKEIISESRSYSDIVNLIFKEYALLSGKNCWGDKSAFFKHIPLEVYQKCIPNLKVIHIVRDGRDVSLSWRNIWSGPLTVAESAWLWAKHVQENQRWGMRNSKDYIEIKYEDLLEDRNAVLDKIGLFLGFSEKSEKEIHGSELAIALSTGTTHKLLSGPLVKENTRKWSSYMHESDRQLFEYIAGPVLSFCGYEVGSQKVGYRTKIYFENRIIFSRLITFFSIRHMRRRLKSILPYVLYISHLLSFPLVKILNRRAFK